MEYFTTFHILTLFFKLYKIPYAKFNAIMLRSIQIAFENFFWIEKTLKIDGIMSILRGVHCDILGVKLTIFLIYLLIS